MEYYSKFLIIFICLNAINKIRASNTTEKLEIVVPENANLTATKLANKTIAKLVEEQTDLIKRIVSNHKLTSTEYPVFGHKDATNKDSQKSFQLKETKEKESIEELRRKCQELGRLEKEQSLTTIPSTTRLTTTKGPPTVQAFGPQLRPALLQKLQFLSEQRAASSTRKPTSYFYVTRRPATTLPSAYNLRKTDKDNSTLNLPLATNDLKYIPLEPVMLQKTAMTDGSVLYYWYRNQSPSTVEGPQVREDKPVNYFTERPVADKTQAQTPQSTTDILSRYGINLSALKANINGPSTTSTSTTTSAPMKVSYDGKGTKIPNYEVEYYKSGDEDNSYYKKQLKFIIQMPTMPKNDYPTLYPWHLDPYAYAPQHLQPKIVNVPLPYVPSYQMIRMLQVPNQ